MHAIVDKDGHIVRLGSGPEGTWYSENACRDEMERLNREGLPEFAPYSMVSAESITVS